MPDNNQTLSSVSSEAVARATGRDWDAWLEFLDGLGASAKTHKEIVALVAGPGASPMVGGSSRWRWATSRPAA